jgi:hypothetical protein
MTASASTASVYAPVSGSTRSGGGYAGGRVSLECDIVSAIARASERAGGAATKDAVEGVVVARARERMK